MPFHVFVIMPFGTKESIDFNKVYSEYIKPALEQDRYEVFRADEELKAGEIRTEMFQELLLADLVVADLSIDNPNVWYELGIRHALRPRGIVLIQSKRAYQPFDLYTDRKLHYHIKDGVPDPEFLEEDRKSLAVMANESMASWSGRRISPVYHLLPNLQEPDWKTLRIGEVREFWDRYDAWENRLELARKSGHIGDMLLLADEAPVSAFRAEAWFRAGHSLLKACRYDFALEQLDKGLKITPDYLNGLQDKGICLQRLAALRIPKYTLDNARMHYQRILQQDRYHEDPETWALLGRVDKDAWVDVWRQPNAPPEEMRQTAVEEDALLRNAIDSYTKAYRFDPAHYYSGINALTLMYLYHHLTGEDRYDREMQIMSGAVLYAAECEKKESDIYWAKATIGDLEVLAGTPETVKAAYKEAVAKNDKKLFDPQSSLDQLQLLKYLDFHPKQVDAAISVLSLALQRLAKPDDQWHPDKVLLFSGHMIDKPDRKEPRFPAENENIAAQKIAEVLDELGVGPTDLALTQGACGGDLLFSEACIQRKVRVFWMQPFAEPEFIRNSVVCSSESWRQRYFNAKSQLAGPIRTAPDELGELPQGAKPGYPYERCNLWLLYTSLAYGIDTVRFICLWNGGGSDGSGGTTHMYNEVNKRTGQVYWLNTNNMFNTNNGR